MHMAQPLILSDCLMVGTHEVSTEGVTGTQQGSEQKTKAYSSLSQKKLLFEYT